MTSFCLYIFLIIAFGVSAVLNGTIDVKEKVDTELQGLYQSGDKVIILTNDNFDAKIFNKPIANVVEFYNSWCGHCKRFAPVWKELAADVYQWNYIVAIGAIDCADDKNNGVCRNYEILEYPTLKFFHQNYKSDPQQIGEIMKKGGTAQDLRLNIVQKLKQEQIEGRGNGWPLLNSQKYVNLDQVWVNLPSEVKVVFLIFESDNATMAMDVILDLNIVFGIGIRKVSDNSPLVRALGIVSFPALVVINKDLSSAILTPKDSTRHGFRNAIIQYMQTNKFKGIELNDFDDDPYNPISGNNIILGNVSKKGLQSGDVVYQADLETALRYTLSHEISKMKHISGNSLKALQEYLHVLEKYFPFSANGKVYISELKDAILSENVEWTGERFIKTINDLESVYSPVYSTLPKYVGCKGSAPHFRGFPCALWTMFHVLTVNAADKRTSDASEVLKAIHGYVKYFFGCTECSKNFQAMAAERFKSVAEADGAIIWLWTAHNEVNHRLAGDSTEDPYHPKKQFPVAEHCSKCRDEMGAWDFKEVLLYLKRVYGVQHINFTGAIPHPTETSRFTSFDSVLYVLLYIYIAIMLVFILRLFLTKKIYRKKVYIHDTLGKV